MAPSWVLVRTCTVLVVCGGLLMGTASAAAAARASGEQQRRGGGGAGYSHEEGGDYVSRMAAAAAQDGGPLAATAGSSAGQQVHSVLVGPSLFDKNGFTDGIHSAPVSKSAPVSSPVFSSRSVSQPLLSTDAITKPLQQSSLNIPNLPALDAPLNDPAWQKFDQPSARAGANFVSGQSFDLGTEQFKPSALPAQDALVDLGTGIGKTVHAGFNGGQLKASTLPSQVPLDFSGNSNKPNVRDSGSGFPNGGSVIKSSSGGSVGAHLGASGDIGTSTNAFPALLKTDFNQDLFPGDASDAQLYRNTDADAFPDTLNNDNHQPSFPPIVGRSSASKTPQQTLGDGHSLAATSANAFADGNAAFNLDADNIAKPLSFPNSRNAGGTVSLSRSTFPSSGAGKRVSSGSVASSKTQQRPIVTTSSSARNTILDSGLKSSGGAVQLNQNQISKLGKGSSLVTDLLNGNDVYSFDEIDNFNAGDAFKQNDLFSNAGSSVANRLGANLNRQAGNSKFGGGSGKVASTVLVGSTQLGQNQEDSIGQELDARSAAVGFPGISDSSDGRQTLGTVGAVDNLHSRRGGLSGGSVLSGSGSGSRSFRPASDFHVNTDVRGGLGGAGLKTSGGLGVRRDFSSADGFSGQGGLVGRGTGSSFVNPYKDQNPLSGNAVFSQQAIDLGGGQLVSPSGLRIGTGSGVTGNAGGLSKPSFSQQRGLGQAGVSRSLGTGLGTNPRLNAATPNFALGKQSFPSGSRSKAVNLLPDNNGLGSVGSGSAFNRQGIKSGVLDNIADNSFKPGRVPAFHQNGLASSGVNTFNRKRGLGSTAPNAFNTQPNAFTSGSKGSSSFPQSFNGNSLASSGKGLTFGTSHGTGSGLGKVAGRSSTSSFSSSSGSTFGSGGTGAFSGPGVGVGNSLTGVSFGSLDKLGRGGSAVVGSSRKVFDSGLVGTSTSVSGGGRQSFSSGSGSSSSGRTSSAFSNGDLGSGGSGSPFFQTHASNAGSAGGKGSPGGYTGTSSSHS